MEAPNVSYLSLLEEVSGNLEQLAALAREKTAAVRKDDLMALDQVLNQEQAMSLTFRGLEQKRLKLLKELGWEKIPLSALADQYPTELRPRARQTAENLRTNYELYHAAAQAARNSLERTLRELDKLVAGMGGSQPGGAGYTPPDVQPPSNMKTDFRA